MWREEAEERIGMFYMGNSFSGRHKVTECCSVTEKRGNNENMQHCLKFSFYISL